MAQASAARFFGVFTALVTPMQKGSGPVPEIDEAALVQSVEAQIRGGVQGLVARGTTGKLRR